MSSEKFAADYLGKEIKVGSTVVYPVRQGSSMWLNKGVVTQVVPVAEDFRIVVYDPDSHTRRGHSVKNLHTCVVVAEPEESK